MIRTCYLCLLAAISLPGELLGQITDPKQYMSPYENESQAFTELTNEQLKWRLDKPNTPSRIRYLLQRTLFFRNAETENFCEDLVKEDDFEGTQQCLEIKLKQDQSYLKDMQIFYRRALKYKMYTSAAKAGIAIMGDISFRGDFLNFEKKYKEVMKDIPKDAVLSHLDINLTVGTSYAVSNSPPIIDRGLQLLLKVDQAFDQNKDQLQGEFNYHRLKYNIGVFYMKINQLVLAEKYLSQGYGHPRLYPDATIIHSLVLYLLDPNTPGLVEKLNAVKFEEYDFSIRITFLECYRNYLYFKLGEDYDMSHCYKMGTDVQVDALLHLTMLIGNDDEVPDEIMAKIDEQFRKFYEVKLAKMISDSVNRVIDSVELQRIERENQRKELALAKSQLVVEEQNSFQRLMMISALLILVVIFFLWWLHKEKLELKLLREKQDHEDKIIEIGEISAVINSLNQAIVVINEKDGSLETDSVLKNENYRRILGSQSLKTELNIFSILFERTNLQKMEIERIKNFFEGVFGENDLNFKINKSVLPVQCRIDQKFLQLDYNPVLDDQNVLVKVVVSITDVTETVALQEELIQHKRDTSKILEMIEYGLNSSKKILNEFKMTLRDAVSEDIFTSDLRLRSMKNLLHNAKGNFRLAGFEQMALKIHAVEDHLTQGNQERLDLSLNLLCQSLDQYLELLDRKLSAEKAKEGPAQFLDQLESIFCSFKDAETLKEKLFDAVRQEYTAPWGEFERSLRDVLSKISLDAAVTVELNLRLDEGDLLFLRKDIGDMLKTVFVHLFNNSIAHGSNDNDVLSIHIDISNGERMQIHYRDSGPGLNLSKLAKRQVTDMSEKQIAETIFEQGVSTSEDVTLISGRGVGMSAVRELIRRAQGEVHIELCGNDMSSEFRDFMILIELPSSSTFTEVKSA
ncbi:MAG: hypothetical protein HRU19_19725 [Pseudobacteriovorax sp.]|nr:hypothetical protein [Pseudobacteriovorax sp.]